jgi:hypothetical protein
VISTENGFPPKTCGNDADDVILAGIAGIQLFWMKKIFEPGLYIGIRLPKNIIFYIVNINCWCLGSTHS